MRGDASAVRELLRGHDPATLDSTAQHGSARDVGYVIDRVLDDVRRRGERGVAARSYRRRRALLLLPVSAAMVAAAVLLSTGIVGSQATIDPAAAQAARNAARLVQMGPDPGPLTPGKVWYSRGLEKTEHTVTPADGGDDYHYITLRRLEMWTSGDGTQRLRYRVVGAPEFPTAEDRRRFEADPNHAERVKGLNLDHDGKDPLRSYRELMAMPTDPDRLFAIFKAKSEGHSTGTYNEMFTLVSDALREPLPLPSTLRAGFYEVIARLPGVRLVRQTTDLAGRQCGALVMEDSHFLGAVKESRELLFDPQAAEFRGSREQVLRNRFPFGPRAGTVVGYQTLEVAGFVDSIGSTQIRR